LQQVYQNHDTSPDDLVDQPEREVARWQTEYPLVAHTLAPALHTRVVVAQVTTTTTTTTEP